MNPNETTLIIIKPDGMQKNLLGIILDRLTRKGLRLIGGKIMRLDEPLLRQHYDFLTDKPFFPDILSYMQESPVFVGALTGPQAILVTRNLLGPTDSTLAPAGTIRGDFGESKSRNIAHASDSIESAQKEIARFFKPQELFG